MRWFLVAALFASSILSVQAQVAPAATGTARNLWVGGEFSLFNPDYDPNVPLTGIGIYADYNLTSKVGAEGEARFSGVLRNEDGNETQKDYLLGP